ncbi:hypothetical protein OHB39_25125 [Streptomyces sp. NBC_00047]|nr:hypothetical protein [Streptomyces sp. NBC_00047]MCX5610820.1 hypothetical protein [Streptomyces sp. NBC_00047]
MDIDFFHPFRLLDSQLEQLGASDPSRETEIVLDEVDGRRGTATRPAGLDHQSAQTVRAGTHCGGQAGRPRPHNDEVVRMLEVMRGFPEDAQPHVELAKPRRENFLLLRKPSLDLVITVVGPVIGDPVQEQKPL